MNAKRVSATLCGGYASAGFAEACEDATAVKPWSFTGLFDQLKTDGEVASVLAHELGHCAAFHTVKKYQAGLGYSSIEALIISRVSEGARNTVNTVSRWGMELISSAYGRQDEFQADLLGLKYMYLAGYNPNAMIEAFHVLKRLSSGAGLPLILRSHPYLDDRIKAAAEEVKKLPEKYGKAGNRQPAVF